MTLYKIYNQPILQKQNYSIIGLQKRGNRSLGRGQRIHVRLCLNKTLGKPTI
jgi:hypothetical protein